MEHPNKVTTNFHDQNFETLGCLLNVIHQMKKASYIYSPLLLSGWDLLVQLILGGAEKRI